MKLTTRFMLLLLGMALIPLALSAVWQVYQQKTIKRNLFGLHQGVADFAASGIDEWFAGVNRGLAFITEIDRPGPGGRKSEEFAVIQQAVLTNSDIMSLALLSPEGKVLMRAQDPGMTAIEQPSDYSGDKLVTRVKNSGQAAAGDVLDMGGRPALALAYPLSDGRVVHIYFSLTRLWRNISSHNTGESGMLVVAGADGTILPGQGNIPGGIALKKLSGMFSAADRGVIDTLRSSAGNLAGAYKTAVNLPWAAMSLQKRSELTGPQTRSLYGFFVFALISLAACVIVAHSISGKISRPILSLTKGAERIGNKDLNSPVPEEGWPEIKTLASVFNKMMAELKKYNALQINKIIEEKTKAETLIKTIPDGVLLTDSEGRMIYSNPTALRLLGLPPSASDVMLPLSVKRQEFHKGLQEVMQEREKTVSADIEIEPRDDKSDSSVKKSYRIISAPYNLPDHKAVGRVMILRDITAEKKMDRMKDEFFHMITHDMRGPLSTIQGYMPLLARAVPPSPKTDKYFENVGFATRVLRGMADDILNLNKMESGGLILQLTQADIGEILKNIQSAYEPAAALKGIRIMVGPMPPGLSFMLDAAIIERVTANLVGNALKFTPQGGSVTLTCSAFGEKTAEVCVADTGPGIPDDKKEFIFEKYRQMEGHEHMGYGMGLAMCKMAVELHGGRIWVESEPGQGSLFKFTLSRNLRPAPLPAA
ncbi:MAG: ATP-binding protein [bacterium]